MTVLRTCLRRTQVLRAFWRNQRGVSAVEFALVAPILILILAATVDLGGALRLKFNLDAALSASANYALVNGDRITSATSEDLVNSLAAIAASELDQESVAIGISINGAAERRIDSGVTSAPGSNTRADSCYCPVPSGNTINWGATRACGSVCPGNTGVAGKFVVIRAAAQHTPLFGGYGIVEDGVVSAQTVVQPQ